MPGSPLNEFDLDQGFVQARCNALPIRNLDHEMSVDLNTNSSGYQECGRCLLSGQSGRLAESRTAELQKHLH